MKMNRIGFASAALMLTLILGLGSVAGAASFGNSNSHGVATSLPNSGALQGCGVMYAHLLVNQSFACGRFTVELLDLGQPNAAGQAPADVALVWKNGIDRFAIPEYSSQAVVVNGQKVAIQVGQTFAGLYYYQRWADIRLLTR